MRFPRKPRSHLKLILKYISSVAYSLDLIYNFTECGMEFQTDTPIVVKDFSIFSVLEKFYREALIRRLSFYYSLNIVWV